MWRTSYIEEQRPRVQLGEIVTWKPMAFWDGMFPGAIHELTGRVIYINEEHRYYVAEADCHGTPLREAFRF